jgi:cell division septum initiation protein DivIVA
MRYTPVELRHVKPPRRLLGYKRSEVDQLLEDVVQSFEEVWRERGELADKLEDAEKQLDDVKQREALLAQTLVAAERTAAEAIERAKREAEIIVAEAHQESRSITRGAQNERERLFTEARRVETLLRSALSMVEESHREPAAEAAKAAAEELWPRREDTREFQAVSLDAAAHDESVQPLHVDEAVAAHPEPEQQPEPEATPLPPVVQDVLPQTTEEPVEHGDFVWGR